MTPKFDRLANQYIEEGLGDYLDGLTDAQKKKLLALGVGSALAMPGTAYLGHKAGEKLFSEPDHDQPAPKIQKVEAPNVTPPGIRPVSPPPAAMPPQQTPVKQAVTKPQYTPEFIQYMKRVENGIKMGLKKGKWYPHESAEGGAKTIAFGHKLKTGEDFSKGLTDKEATQLLLTDLNIAKEAARKYVGSDKFDKLDSNRQEMLIDYQFNLGTLKTFPKFVTAVLKNDKKGMLKHYQRKYQHPKTKKWLPIKDRNNQFKQRYLK